MWQQTVDPRGASGTSEVAEFSPDGRYIAAGAADGKLRFYTSSGQKVWEAVYNSYSDGKDGEIESIFFSPNGEYVAAGGNRGGVKIYRTSNGQSTKSLSGSDVDGMSWSPNGQWLATADGSKVTVYNTSDWSVRYKLSPGGSTNSIEFTKDNQHIITAGSNRQVRISRADNGSLVRSFTSADSEGSVKSVRLSPDGSLIATANGKDTSVKIFKLDGSFVKELDLGSITIAEAVAWSADGKWLAAGGGGGSGTQTTSSLRVYRTSDWSLVHNTKGHSQGIEYIDFAPDGTILTSSEDGSIIHWTAPSGTSPSSSKTGTTSSPSTSTPKEVVIEAENIQNLSNFQVESNISAASNGKVLGLKYGAANEQGKATFDFTGVQGKYNVVVGYFDETDGVASASLSVEGQPISSWNFDKNLGSSLPTSQNRTTHTISNVLLAPGDTIQLSGVENDGEYVRVDKISFIPI
jgi:WD40 repeat protein